MYSLSIKWLMYVILFLHLSTSLGCFCPWAIFSQNELDKLPWTSFVSGIYTKLVIISRSDQCLATDSPCGVKPWMNHLPPVRWPTFRFMFLNDSRCANLAWLCVCWRGEGFYLFLAFIHVMFILPKFPQVSIDADSTLFLIAYLINNESPITHRCM